MSLDLIGVASGIDSSNKKVNCNTLRGPYRPYATLQGGVEVVISKNHASMIGIDDLDVDVLIEAPTEDGFKSMRINVPMLRVEHVDGMSKEEVSLYRRYVSTHCSDIADRLEEIWDADNR